MTSFIQFLENKTEIFSFTVRGVGNIETWLVNQLLGNPAIASTISSYSYRTVHTSSGVTQVTFNIKYDTLPPNSSVYLAKNNFDIQTALSVAFRLHQETILLVVDNRTGFMSQVNRFESIKFNKEFVGEEFHIHQLHSSNYSLRSFFEGKIIIYVVKFSYFDSAKETNDLSCLIAEQAQNIQKVCRNNKIAIINHIMVWFRNNIEYLDTNKTDDHSAIGLIKNKTAVCQGIAAYAYQLLSFCGIDARYVSGDGLGSDGWGSHGWNMVYINNRWIHIDYTFELNSHALSVIKTEKNFIKDHRWDTERYSYKQSQIVSNARKVFRHSLMVLLPEQFCYSINGCIVDVSNAGKICITSNNTILVSLFDIISIYGGCYSLDKGILSIYISTRKYTLPFSQIKLINNKWYAPVGTLIPLGFKVQIEGDTIVLKNQN